MSSKGTALEERKIRSVRFSTCRNVFLFGSCRYAAPYAKFPVRLDPQQWAHSALRSRICSIGRAEMGRIRTAISSERSTSTST